jgi:ADP-ribose pyrophosphatase YjhB (NUDIX family)
MLKRLWQWCGIIAFWLTWPASWLYLHHGQRTRVLVVVGDEVLVVKPWLGAGKWILPGGGVHWREDPVQGALRELREETGVRLAAPQLTLLHRATFRQYGLRFPYTCYMVKLAEKPQVHRQLLELTDYTWLPITQATPVTCLSDVLAALEYIAAGDTL